MNSTLSIPCIFSCALDSFLEIASCLFLPHLSDLTVRNEFTELLFNTCSRYVESPENSRLLEEIREPIWAYLREQCPSFSARDSNACFSQIFEEKTLGKLTSDEMNIFSSLRTFQSFCETCQKDVVLNSSILVNFVTRSALEKCKLNYNSWPQFVSSVQTQPGKLKCPDCETPTYEPVLTSTAHSKFVFIEFAPELMNVIKLYENISVGQAEYKLKGMVRSYNKHFTCAVFVQGKWTYFDDLCTSVKEFTGLAALTKQFKQGWFFLIYELSNIFCEVTDFSACTDSIDREMKEEVNLSNKFCEVTDFSAYTGSKSREMKDKVRLNCCEKTSADIVKRGHFMNSVINTCQVYSCAVDSFLEVASYLFLPHLSDLNERNEFTELLFNACSRYVESPENSRLLEEIREPIWAYLREQCPSFSSPTLLKQRLPLLKLDFEPFIWQTLLTQMPFATQKAAGQR